MSDLPHAAQLNSEYADDVSFDASDNNHQIIDEQLCAATDDVSAWSVMNGLSISPTKSMVTLFSNQLNEYRYDPRVFINGVQLPMNNSPKLLGVVLSNGWTSDKQVLTIRQKCQGPLNLLKALCCTGWGCGQETLVMTYKAVGESVIIRRTNLGSKCHQDENLQCLQNKFLWICTRTHSNCGANHLYMETETLPIKVKLEMLCCQFLASACCPSHPLNPIV